EIERKKEALRQETEASFKTLGQQYEERIAYLTLHNNDASAAKKMYGLISALFERQRHLQEVEKIKSDCHSRAAKLQNEQEALEKQIVAVRDGALRKLRDDFGGHEPKRNADIYSKTDPRPTGLLEALAKRKTVLYGRKGRDYPPDKPIDANWAGDDWEF